MSLSDPSEATPSSEQVRWTPVSPNTNTNPVNRIDGNAVTREGIADQETDDKAAHYSENPDNHALKDEKGRSLSSKKFLEDLEALRRKREEQKVALNPMGILLSCGINAEEEEVEMQCQLCCPEAVELNPATESKANPENGDKEPGGPRDDRPEVESSAIAEEAQPAILAREPGNPTAQEREDHNATHLPFRSWCRACGRTAMQSCTL